MLNEKSHVCVIGAGTMGAGIAAHLANLGFQVTLLDLSEESARAGLDRAKRARPPHFYISETADTIRLGSIADHLGWVSEADWVCEAIVEKLDLKRALFERIEPLLRPDTFVTTNTSGLQIELLSQGRSAAFQRTFMGTHFFNPPRHLKLLELIPTSTTDPAAVREMTAFLENDAGRRVVPAKDTPGFIANRYGMWSMIFTVEIADKLGLTIEEVDAICGPFLGRPRSAAFRLNDLVGLDIMQDIANNLRERCPHDPHAQALGTPSSMAVLLEKGWIGNKAGQGYYRKEGQEFFSFDLVTHAYRMRQEPNLATLDELAKQPIGPRLREALVRRDQVGDFLRSYLIPALQYAHSLREEISYHVQDFDRVMKWGFGWELGPFEMIDAIGAEALGLETPAFYQAGTQLEFNGDYAPLPNEPAYRTFTDFPVIEEGGTFRVRNLGDGVVALAVTTKMGTVNPQLVTDLTAWLTRNPTQPFVLTSEARAFSLGFDLRFFQEASANQDWDAVNQALRDFQNLCRRLAQSRGVSAVFGYCIGGGLELAGACPILVAHPETQIGFPESKVGLLPGGGGTVISRLAVQGNVRGMGETVSRLVLGELSLNPDDARKHGILRRTDRTAYHPDRLLMDAKAVALTVQPGTEPEWNPNVGPAMAIIDQRLDDLQKENKITNHDRKIGDKITQVFVKPQTLEDAYTRERDVFIELLKEGLTQARIRHMVETNKPLRN